MRFPRYLLATIFFVLSIFSSAQPSKSEEMGKVVVSIVDKIQKGNIALLDTKNSRIVELEMNGTVVWQTKFPDLFRNGAWNAGADIEWLEHTDTFLIAVPMAGFFEISRDGKIITQCKSKFISHDVDKIADDLFIFVNGWDDKGKDEPIIRQSNIRGNDDNEEWLSQTQTDEPNEDNV